MSECAWHRVATWTVGGIVGGTLLLWTAACKPEAPAETAAAGSPEEGPAPEVAAEAVDSPEASAADGATLAATTPTAADAAGDSAGEAAVAEADVPAEPEPPAFVPPEEPLRVLIIGDSLAATGIGALLERKLDAHPHVVCYRKGKSSSGLARPDFFDWKAEAKAQIEFRKPNLVVVILGGNDGQDITRHDNGTGRRVAWKHEDWAVEYRERVDELLEVIAADDRKVLWLGLPQMGMSSLEKKLTLIRDVQQNAVEALGDGGVYLDTVPFVTNEEGDLLDKAKVGPKGKLQAIRSEDRIHFTMAGSEYFADRVYPSVLEALALPDVEPEP